jgi:hypothetical protein
MMYWLHWNSGRNRCEQQREIFGVLDYSDEQCGGKICLSPLLELCLGEAGWGGSGVIRITAMY